MPKINKPGSSSDSSEDIDYVVDMNDNGSLTVTKVRNWDLTIFEQDGVTAKMGNNPWPRYNPLSPRSATRQERKQLDKDLKRSGSMPLLLDFVEKRCMEK